jgi:hypothetical protein
MHPEYFQWFSGLQSKRDIAMNLTINRFFYHATDKKCTIKTTMRKIEEDGLYNLYIESVSGDDIKDDSVDSGCKSMLLSPAFKEDEWLFTLEAWAKEQNYQGYIPNKLSAEEARVMIEKCRDLKRTSSRLGQALLYTLGDDSPTPNPDIYHSRDENKVLEWFYENHVAY